MLSFLTTGGRLWFELAKNSIKLLRLPHYLLQHLLHLVQAEQNLSYLPFARQPKVPMIIIPTVRDFNRAMKLYGFWKWPSWMSILDYMGRICKSSPALGAMTALHSALAGLLADTTHPGQTPPVRLNPEKFYRFLLLFSYLLFFLWIPWNHF